MNSLHVDFALDFIALFRSLRSTKLKKNTTRQIYVIFQAGMKSIQNHFQTIDLKMEILHRPFVYWFVESLVLSDFIYVRNYHFHNLHIYILLKYSCFS